MAKVKVTLNRAAVAELLKSPAMQAQLRSEAEKIADRAGPGHEVDVYVGRNRARASVATVTNEARINEARNRTLSFAAGAGITTRKGR